MSFFFFILIKQESMNKMNKKKTLEKIKTLEKAKYGEFYCELKPAYQTDFDIVNAIYPFVLGSETGSEFFKKNIRAYYALDYKWVKRMLKYKGSDSWILAFVDPAFFSIRERESIAIAALKADYVYYGYLSPLSEGVIEHLELGDRVQIVKNIVKHFPIIYNKLPKHLKFNPIIQFCMFGESGAFQNDHLKNKN